MWTPLVTAAVMLAGAQGSAFSPPDCVRAVPAGTHNGPLVVSPRGKSGLWLASESGRLKRQLTRGHDSEASFSPSGRKMVFHRITRRGRDKIVTLDLSSGRTRTIFTPAAREENFAQVPLWSPDGRWIAFLSEQSSGTGDDERSRTDVVMVRPDGTGAHAVHRVSNLTTIPTLAQSANGRCFAYQWGSFSTGFLAVGNLREGVNLIPFGAVLPDGVGLFVPLSVAFGADGRQLFVSFPVSANGKRLGDRIFSLPMEKQAFAFAVVDHAGYPVPSPDGRSLTYYSFDDHWMHIRKLSGAPRDRRLLKGVVWDWTPAG
jgi:hypothetical protein